MIQRLSIRNYVLIAQLDLEFGPGLTIITGETGAGKSILLGALGLVLGERASGTVLADAREKAVIEGEFAIRELQLESFFTDHDLEYDEVLILRREISPQGRSRAFVNDSPAPLSVVRELGLKLIDVHQQFDQLDVLDESFQLRMLDALAGNREQLNDYQHTFLQWQESKRALQLLTEAEGRAAQELDFLRFQLEEFENAGLQLGELAQLEEEARVLGHAEEIRRILAEAQHRLDGEESGVVDQIGELLRQLSTLREVNQSLGDLTDRLESIHIDLGEWAGACRDLGDSIEADPARQQEVEARLDLVQQLMHKHRVTEEQELHARWADITEQVKSYARHDEHRAELEQQVAKLTSELRELASSLHVRRAGQIDTFLAGVHARLGQLGMERIHLVLDLMEQDELGPTGFDRVRFTMAQSASARHAPVREAASGGELSRLTLVIKSLVAAAIPLPSLVFDEIDSGVSGKVSTRMSELLTRMAGEHQLIVITHSPQIAARATTHLEVCKTAHEGGAETTVRALNRDERTVAIAIMLSTDPPTAAAMANARELIEA